VNRATLAATDALHAEIVLTAAYGVNRKQIALIVGTSQWNVGHHLRGACGCGLPWGQRTKAVFKPTSWDSLTMARTA
jgi:hypothetical protein